MKDVLRETYWFADRPKVRRHDNGRLRPPSKRALAVLDSGPWTALREAEWDKCPVGDLLSLPHVRRARLLKW